MPDPAADAITPKPWWTSKSVWLGVVLTIIGVTTYFGDPLHTPTMTLASISEAVGGVALTILRVWFTSTAVAGTPMAQKVETAKQTIALDAAVQATAGPTTP